MQVYVHTNICMCNNAIRLLVIQLPMYILTVNKPVLTLVCVTFSEAVQ